MEHRDSFAGKHVYDSFAGYAYQQLLKMQSRDPAEIREYLALTAEAKARGIHPNHKGKVLQYPEEYDTNSGEARNALAHSDDVLLARLRHYMKKGENLGYLGDKRKKLILEHGHDAKNAAHCIRLLRMASEYLRTGKLTVFRPDADELLEIKRGQWSLDRIKAHAEELFLDMKDARDESPLPEEPDQNKVQQLLIQLLRQHLFSK